MTYIEQLHRQFQQVREDLVNGLIDLKTAAEINNSLGKQVRLAQVELADCHMKGVQSNSLFFKGNGSKKAVNGLTLENEAPSRQLN